MQLVLVEWLDSYGASARWAELTDAAVPVLRCRSVGWLRYDGDECKVIVPHIAEETENTYRQGCGDMTIPSVAITRLVELAEIL